MALYSAMGAWWNKLRRFGDGSIRRDRLAGAWFYWNRKRKPHRGSGAGIVLGRYATGVCFDDAAGYRETHAHAAAFALRGVEGFEDLSEPVSRDARASIRHGQPHFAVELVGRDSHAPFLGRRRDDGVHPVHQEIQEHLLQVD